MYIPLFGSFQKSSEDTQEKRLQCLETPPWFKDASFKRVFGSPARLGAGAPQWRSSSSSVASSASETSPDLKYGDPFVRVAVQELNLSYHNTDTW